VVIKIDHILNHGSISITQMKKTLDLLSKNYSIDILSQQLIT